MIPVPVPRYRIRYQGTDLEMPLGEFVVGRSASCHLALDDPLVSRRHATIHVEPDGAWVEDLGSRNGVLVNGERIEGRRALSHLDRIAIGTHQLVFVEVSERTSSSAACDACGADMTADMQFCQRCGKEVGGGGPTRAAMTLELPVEKIAQVRPLPPVEPAPPTRPPPAQRPDATRPYALSENETTGRALLTGIADKALALGRFEEAERVLSTFLKDLLTCSREQPLQPERVQEAARYAIRLAEGTRRSAWLDYVFELYEVHGRLMSGDEIDKLHETVRKLRYRGIGPVRRYLDAIRTKAGELGPTERFLLSRLESLERLVSA
jgi:hypothetical protein